jgi:hypothetical protein
LKDTGNEDFDNNSSDSEVVQDLAGSEEDNPVLKAALEKIKRVGLDAEATVRRLHAPKSKGKEKNKPSTTQTTAVALHGMASIPSGSAAVHTASQPVKVRLKNINVFAKKLNSYYFILMHL